MWWQQRREDCVTQERLHFAVFMKVAFSFGITVFLGFVHSQAFWTTRHSWNCDCFLPQMGNFSPVGSVRNGQSQYVTAHLRSGFVNGRKQTVLFTLSQLNKKHTLEWLPETLLHNENRHRRRKVTSRLDQHLANFKISRGLLFALFQYNFC